MSNPRKICSIYRSPKDEGMFLFVEKSIGLQEVPESLLERFGKPIHSMTLLIDSERRLARTDASTVLNAISEQGYYLQLPPPKDESMQAVNAHNSKLPR